MKNCVPMLVGFVLLVCAEASAHEFAAELAKCVGTFQRSLTEAQRLKLEFPMDEKKRSDWHFIPKERDGLAFGELKPAQRLHAMVIVSTILNHRGFTQSMQIMALEQVLHELENQAPHRNPQKYHWHLFGTPSTEKTWGLRLEGHHLSLNLTVVDGKRVSATPFFMGANPARVTQGPLKGLQVFEQEEKLARRLLGALDESQRKVALFSGRAPGDVLNGPQKEAEPLEPVGLYAKNMSAEQKKSLRDLVESCLQKTHSEISQPMLSGIQGDRLDGVAFGWAGSMEVGQPHYFRIQSTRFVIEYDNVQNGANHVHLVFRDLKNDFGRDWLREHRALKHSDKK